MTPAEIASEYLDNADVAVEAANEIGLPLAVAFTLLDMESEGKNVFGHDSNGMFKGQEVTESRYQEMVAAVAEGGPSNGVGPTQITYRTFFPDAESKGLRLWIPYENMLYGFSLLMSHYTRKGNWRDSATAYNGKSTYGATFARILAEWERRLEGASQPEELCGMEDGW